MSLSNIGQECRVSRLPLNEDMKQIPQVSACISPGVVYQVLRPFPRVTSLDRGPFPCDYFFNMVILPFWRMLIVMM